MLRLHDAAGALTLVSRLARPHVLVILAVILAAPAVLARARPALAWALGGGAALLLVLGGRSTRARLAGGRVWVRPAWPPGRTVARDLAGFTGARVETLGEARARREAERAREYAARAGGAPLPAWLRRPASASANDPLRRLVLVQRGGEPVPLTAWLPPEDDLEAARAAVERLLPR